MIIQSLQLEAYRNYQTCDIHFSPGVTILYGDNAQGKTNILEAVYVSATTKSHRGSKDREMIGFSNDEAHIRSVWDKDGMSYRVDMHLRKNKAKGIAVNGQFLKKAAQLLGICNVVFFSPEDLSIIKSGPERRRRFMDMELSQMDASYLYHLNQYNKVVNQRNALLKEMSFHLSSYSSQQEMNDVLSVWNKQLLIYGSRIIERRQKYIQDLNSIIKPIHDDLSGKREDIKVIYDPFTSLEDFEENLIKSTDRDLKYKMTHVGPHKDDVIFEIGGIDIRKFGSQGQQRTAALSLKLSEIEMIKLIKNEVPVLLLDDVLSELDSGRQDYLLSRIGDIQTIITCTGVEEFIKRRIHIDTIYEVKDGVIILKE